MTRRVVAIVQARMSSQRLPGKVLAELPSAAGRELTVLDWTVQRVRRARGVADVLVATSDTSGDDRLAAHCAAIGIGCSRGSLDDVLDRMHAAAESAAADVVVRVTADCPLVDPAVVDTVVERHLARGGDFTANRLPPPAHRTYPVGLDVEVVSRAALDRAWREARWPHEREHVLPYLYEQPGRFDVEIVQAPVDAGTVRWTVDTAADLHAVRELVRLSAATFDTPWRALLAVWRANPELAAINGASEQRTAADVDPRRR